MIIHQVERFFNGTKILENKWRELVEVQLANVQRGFKQSRSVQGDLLRPGTINSR